ncbi:hypothetical protein BU16DRAFT_140649 [Lophium mytilinum]|uniref:Uncharacterized protein n=1 Tax=Lophium mytilinum TaxID=390894 RepID=A0A6A6QFP1_9PEZI|nr:hypothetical protein BU16DRAFT_140649 [Lophium mytilinum]
MWHHQQVRAHLRMVREFWGGSKTMEECFDVRSGNRPASVISIAVILCSLPRILHTTKVIAAGSNCSLLYGDARYSFER